MAADLIVMKQPSIDNLVSQYKMLRTSCFLFKIRSLSALKKSNKLRVDRTYKHLFVLHLYVSRALYTT